MNFGDARLPDRFWSKATPCPMSGCWLWFGAWTTAGYGSRTTGESRSYAHRDAYTAEHGAIPQGLDLDHLCRTKCCVNPRHLEAVTHRVNTRRGHGFGAQRHVADADDCCLRGHRFTMQNLYIDKYGKRRCRACMNEKAAKVRDRKRKPPRTAGELSAAAHRIWQTRRARHGSTGRRA